VSGKSIVKSNNFAKLFRVSRVCANMLSQLTVAFVGVQDNRSFILGEFQDLYTQFKQFLPADSFPSILRNELAQLHTSQHEKLSTWLYQLEQTLQTRQETLQTVMQATCATTLVARLEALSSQVGSSIVMRFCVKHSVD
jgi:hypothetical protein